MGSGIPLSIFAPLHPSAFGALYDADDICVEGSAAQLLGTLFFFFLVHKLWFRALPWGMYAV